MYSVYYCVIRTVSENSDLFWDSVRYEAHAEGYVCVQTAGGLVNPWHSAHSTPAALSCLGDFLFAWAVGSNAEGSCASNGSESALNLPF